MKPAQTLDPLRSGQAWVIGIAEHHLRARRGNVFGQHALYGSRRADGHEGRSFDRAMGVRTRPRRASPSVARTSKEKSVMKRQVFPESRRPHRNRNDSPRQWRGRRPASCDRGRRRRKRA